jgi:hypothetical protein
MNMPTERYPRRHRQFSSKNLDSTFSGEEPQEEGMLEQLPSPPTPTIDSPRWRRLFFVRAPSRRVPRRFAFTVPMDHSS